MLGTMGRKRYGIQGFTLVELLVALVVMAFIAIISYGAFDNLLQVEERSKDLFIQQSRIYMAQSVILNDLLHLRARPVRDSLGGQIEAYLAPENAYQVAFTRGGLPDFESMRGGIQRVAYRVEEGKLIRTTWEVADQSPLTEKTDYVLTGGLNRLAFEQLDYQGNFSPIWPPLNQRTQLQALPVAVRVTFELEDGGTMELLIPTPGAASNNNTTVNGGADED